MHHLTLVCAVVLLLVVVAPSHIYCDTLYDALELYGLPPGLLPGGILGYSIVDDESGDGSRNFVAELRSSSCYVHFPSSNVVYYNETIMGKLTDNQSITNISGIQTKYLLLWVPVTSILAPTDKDTVEFQLLNLVSQTMPKSDFQSVLSCQASVGSGDTTAALLSVSS